MLIHPKHCLTWLSKQYESIYLIYYVKPSSLTIQSIIQISFPNIHPGATSLILHSVSFPPSVLKYTNLGKFILFLPAILQHAFSLTGELTGYAWRLLLSSMFVFQNRLRWGWTEEALGSVYFFF